MSRTRSPRTAAWRNPHAAATAGARRIADALLLGDELRKRVRQGFALGTFVIELPTPGTILALAAAGFDFVVLDMEHSATDVAQLEPLLLAAHAAGLPAIVRPCSHGLDVIGKILDMGAHGVMAPHVDTPERAQGIVQHSRFPPLGKRGFSPLSRFDGLDRPLAALDRATFVIVQVEGRLGLERIEEIAAAPGVDAIFIGPYDLALSLGVPPQSREVADAARRIARRVPKATLGIYLDDPAQSRAWAARGFTLQCASFDGRMLSHAARSIVERARRTRSTETRK